MSLSFMLIFHDGDITMTNLTEYLQFPAVMRWETNTVALGGAGGPMNVPLQQLTNRTAWLKAQVDAINLILAGDGEEPFIINYLTSESIVDALAANQGRVLKVLYDDLALALANKLDASAYNDHYKGLHISAPNLVLAYPTAQPGDYALVDTGGANDATVYFWDVEGGWVTSGSTVSLTNTDALVEGSANLYFTAERAVASGAAAFPRYDQVAVLSDGDKSRLLTNIGAKKSSNLLSKTVSYVLQLSDFQSAVDLYDVVYLRMDALDSNNITFNTTLSTLPVLTEIDIRNVGAGFSTLVESGTVLNGNKVFDTVNEVKTVRKVGENEWDIIGALS